MKEWTLGELRDKLLVGFKIWSFVGNELRWYDVRLDIGGFAMIHDSENDLCDQWETWDEFEEDNPELYLSVSDFLARERFRIVPGHRSR